MGLIKHIQRPSSRMGILWTVATIGETVVLEFGSMGHMIYTEKVLLKANPKTRSRLITTHIVEKDITFGSTKRLTQCLENMDLTNIKAVFLLPSSIPEIIGIDIESIAFELSLQYPSIKFIAFDKGGLQETYFSGIEEGLYKLCLSATYHETSNPMSVNIIGSTIDLYNFQSDLEEIKRLLKGGLDVSVNSVLSTNTTWLDIEKLPDATINICLCSEAIKACEYLKKTYNMPYIYSIPYGYQGTVKWLNEISHLMGIEVNQDFIASELAEGQYVVESYQLMARHFNQQGQIALGGQRDVVYYLKVFLETELELGNVFTWADYENNYGLDVVSDNDIIDILNAKGYNVVIANQGVIDQTNAKIKLPITNNVTTDHYNIYSSPYMGFRGAMHLYAIFLDML